MSTATQPRLRVFLADDHPVVLSGIKALLLADSGLEVVGEALDGPSAVQVAVALQPDVAVLDLSMPGANGIEVARGLLAQLPRCRVLILTVQEDGVYLRQLLTLGITGYVLKRSAPDGLIRGIYAVAAGGVYLDPAVVGRLLEPPTGDPTVAAAGGAAALSAREIDVLRLSAQGQSNKAIAATLQISVKTVDTYKARAMMKLGFTSRVEMIRFALEQGWLRPA